MKFYQEHKNKVQSWQKRLHSVLILNLVIKREAPDWNLPSESVVFDWTTVLHQFLACPCRGSSFHENDRLSSVAAELHFKSLSRHSSPTEDREGGCIQWSAWFDPHCAYSSSDWLNFPLWFVSPEPSYPKGDPNSAARRSWELRTFISQSKGELV